MKGVSYVELPVNPHAGPDSSRWNHERSQFPVLILVFNRAIAVPAGLFSEGW